MADVEPQMIIQARVARENATMKFKEQDQVADIRSGRKVGKIVNTCWSDQHRYWLYYVSWADGYIAEWMPEHLLRKVDKSPIYILRKNVKDSALFHAGTYVIGWAPEFYQLVQERDRLNAEVVDDDEDDDPPGIEYVIEEVKAL